MKHDETTIAELRAGAAAVGVEVPEEGLARLAEFEELLRDRGLRLGLVAESDAARIRDRHVLDSLRAVLGVEDSDSLAYDIGSGAGLPGLVVAIARPGLAVWLVEPRHGRAGFLELAIERLGIRNAVAFPGRIEDLADPADVCFARAFAPLPDAWKAALPRLKPGGRLVYFAGARTTTPEALPGVGSVRVLETPVLASGGPLIIMAR